LNVLRKESLSRPAVIGDRLQTTIARVTGGGERQATNRQQHRRIASWRRFGKTASASVRR